MRMKKMMKVVLVVSCLGMAQQGLAFSGAISDVIVKSISKGSDNVAGDITARLSADAISKIIAELKGQVGKASYKSFDQVLEDGSLGLLTRENWSYFQVKALLSGVFEADSSLFKVDAADSLDPASAFFDKNLLPRINDRLNSVPENLPDRELYVKNILDTEVFDSSIENLNKLLARNDLDPDLKVKLEDALRLRMALDEHDYDSSIFALFKSQCTMQ